MAITGNYCKAYPLAQLQQFINWSSSSAKPSDKESAAEITKPYLFLQEDYTVTEGIFRDEKIIFSNVTPEWIEFCKDILHFEIPTFQTSVSKKTE
jgi:hypothetical protein